MADPILNGAFRAQVVMTHADGDPAHGTSNSFGFVRKGYPMGGPWDAGDIDTMADEIAERLREFYVEPVAPATQRLLANVPGAAWEGGIEVRVYDLSKPPPRYPTVRTMDTTGVTPNGAVPMPYEVALCSSFFSHRNLPSRRGRVYLGPWVSTAGAEDTSDMPRPQPTIIAMVRDVAQRLASEGAGDNLDWAVISGATLDAYPITAGWVDDGWDTVRRRGIEAASRSAWEGPGHDPTSV